MSSAPQPMRSGTSNLATASAKPERLLSLDAFRGFIMTMLAASGFGVARLASLPEDAPVWEALDYDWWQQIAVGFGHPEWISQFGLVGVSFWDLIQPAFMFMVGVAMPYSYASRSKLHHSQLRQFAHAAWRALVLVLLGVFLQSQRTEHTNWIFTNVLAQIGLGYLILYVLMPQRRIVQVSAFVLILVGYWSFFESYTPPAGYDYAAVNATEGTVFEGRFDSWSKNANAGHEFDLWLLNEFPQSGDEPFRFNAGGYVTLNFIPSIATMMLGMFSGILLRSDRRPWDKFGLLIVSGAVCMVLGLAAGWFVCPIVKRIWTPSWVLFSGAWVIWMLALFYLVFDLWRQKVAMLKWLAFPLVVIGMNSIAMYFMGQLMRPWASKIVRIHFGRYIEAAYGPAILADDMFGRLAIPTLAFLFFWLIAFWMYRQKFFVRV
jgi:heparan-alpha-glucosaminide N-acetyltransferase